MLSPYTSVVQDDVRTARADGACVYCRKPLGEQHAPDCVIRERSHVVRFTIDLVVAEPADWGAWQIEFRYNDGSWCANNFVDILQKAVERMEGDTPIGPCPCLCGCLTATHLREATEEDHAAQRFSFQPRGAATDEQAREA